MNVGFNAAKLVGEHDFCMGVDGNEDYIARKEFLLWPGFIKLMDVIAKDLNRAKLEGDHIIRIRIDCHAQKRE